MDVPPLGPEPSLDHLLRDAHSNGWSFFTHPADRHADGTRKKELNDRTKRVASLAAALWTVPEFRELLDFLADDTLRRATFVAAMGLPQDQAYSFGVFREGQNALVYSIFKLIAQGQKLDPPKGRDP